MSCSLLYLTMSMHIFIPTRICNFGINWDLRNNLFCLYPLIAVIKKDDECKSQPRKAYFLTYLRLVSHEAFWRFWKQWCFHIQDQINKSSQFYSNVCFHTCIIRLKTKCICHLSHTCWIEWKSNPNCFSEEILLFQLRTSWASSALGKNSYVYNVAFIM